MSINIDCAAITQKALEKFSELDNPNINISIHLDELNDGVRLINYSWIKEDSIYYPASLIKLFAAFLTKFKIQQNLKSFIKMRDPDAKDFGSRSTLDDLYDATVETLKHSDNDALSFLVDFISDTSSGLRLEGTELDTFRAKRESIEQFFKARSYTEYLRLRNKCFSFAPYGRDRQLIYEEGDEVMSNRVSINDINKIMKDIKLNYPDLLPLMKRDFDDIEDEHIKFIAAGLTEFRDDISEFYSKAGWTSKVRHDAALIKTNSGDEFLFVIMTKGLSKHNDLIPEIAREIFKKVLS
jgi:hypothetical protein